MSVLTPADENECRQALYTAFLQDHPVAVRYPRGSGAGARSWARPGRNGPSAGRERRGAGLAHRHPRLRHAALPGAGGGRGAPDATVANMRFAKPLDVALVRNWRAATTPSSRWKGCLMGGAGSGRVLNAWPRRAADAGAEPGPAGRVHRAWRPGQAAGACAAWTPPASSSPSSSVSAPSPRWCGRPTIERRGEPRVQPRVAALAVIAGRPPPSNPGPALHIPDTQSERDERHLAIQRVGVKGVRYPMQLKLGAAELATVAEWDLDVALPAEQKGTHMSRFVAWLESLEQAIDAAGCAARWARCSAPAPSEGPHRSALPFFLRKRAPVSGVESLLEYQAAGSSKPGGRSRRLGRGGGAVKSLCPARRRSPTTVRTTSARTSPCASSCCDDIALAGTGALRRRLGFQRDLAHAQARRRSGSPSAPTRTRKFVGGSGARRRAAPECRRVYSAATWWTWRTSSPSTLNAIASSGPEASY